MAFLASGNTAYTDKKHALYKIIFKVHIQELRSWAIMEFKLIIFQFLLMALGVTCSTNNCPQGWTDGLAYGMGCLLFNFNETRTGNETQEFCYEA